MSKSKILIVDDDPSHSRLVAFILNRMGGYDVREENRSLAALATARDYDPHLILLDVDMPEPDGPMICARLRKEPQFALTPIVFVTALVSLNEAGMCNGEHYVPKPVDPILLLNTVRGLCPRFRPPPVHATA